MIKKRIWMPLVALFALWAWNSSPLAPVPADAEAKLLSHRGVHQTYSRDGLTNETCTAERIYPPTHVWLENTVASAQAAFASGADVVEIDIHPTTDGHFVVFHDWTLDCRTNGEGVTREQDLAYLQSLDIGYGYTADGGKTFPLRGGAHGPMPELFDFLAALPNQKFLINFKSNDSNEGEKLLAFFDQHNQFGDQVFGVYGGTAPTNTVLNARADWMGYTKPQTKTCLIQYLAYGWTGIVPEACKQRFVAVPSNYAWLFWGWPNRFQKRMADVGSKVILLGPMSLDDPGSAGIDEIEELKLVPKNFDGYVWTNRIETIGPALKNR